MGHASISCLQAGSSVSSVHAAAYEAILRSHGHHSHRAGRLRALRCHRLLEGLGIIQHHQARGTDAMSDGTRLH